MLTVTGEVRKVLDAEYRDGKQAVVVLEPENQRQNFEVYLSRAQLAEGAKAAWEKLRGHRASVAVSLFVNYEFKFYKFNAVGAGLPTPVK
jgi:hypothetical protein